MVETSRSEGGVGPANVGTEAFNGFVDFVMKPYFSWLPGSLVCLVCGVRRACLRAGWLIHVQGFASVVSSLDCRFSGPQCTIWRSSLAASR